LKGSDEPYRMFTSRAEHRLHLREDNADLRLSELGYRAGLLAEVDYQTFTKKRDAVTKLLGEIESRSLYPNEATNAWVADRGLAILKDKTSFSAFLRRPEVKIDLLTQVPTDDRLDFSGIAEDVIEQAEIQVKYAGYIQRDLELLEGVRKNEMLSIPDSLGYDSVPGLSTEITQRLKETRPETIGQASRLQGVTPAAVANILIYLKMGNARV
jgi:tRNA uridine 5-carboxymethylaminomethyl modification enzyme